MAIEVRMEVPGMTKQHYDGINSQAAPKVRGADGFIAHVAGPIEGGYRVTEVWESREAYERFVQDVIMPIFQSASLPAPQPQFLTVDNAITA